MKSFKIHSWIGSLLFILLVTSGWCATETYLPDTTHSSVEFKVRHLFGYVTGRFTAFEAKIVVDRENFENSQVEATIDVSSVNTANEKRDKHLQAPDYFDVAKYPKMEFKSSSWKKTGENEFDVAGNLTLHGVTKAVVLKVTCLGFGPGMKGAELSGWQARVQIKRSEFGMTNGAPAVGDDVDIEINIEAKKE